MSRNNQNSKWKAHQQANPKSVVVKEEIAPATVKTPEPLVPVEVKVDVPVPTEEKVKPLAKNTKKDAE